MKQSTLKSVDTLIEHFPELEVCREDLTKAVELLCESYRQGHKLLVCGNGGSASDSEHVVGELMKGFIKKRPISQKLYSKMQSICPEHADYLKDNLQGALPAIALVNETALTTAFANDQAPDLSFAQQVLGLGQQGDVLIGISTSGNSANVIYAVEMAKVQGMPTIVLTGKSGGKLKPLADVCICVPHDVTYRIQEYHLPVYHMLCIAVEEEFFEA